MRTYLCRLTFLSALGFLLTANVLAQPIRVNGGNQTMTISTGIAGGQPISVLNTTCSLAYKKQSAISKITVRTSCPGQSFNLDVLATNVTKGSAAPQVSLVNGNPAMDLITDIPRTGTANATCTLQFTASATFSQGNSTELGNDLHAITYTIQVQ
jgi:hypothetical protein